MCFIEQGNSKMSLLGSLFSSRQKPVVIQTPLELVTYSAELASNQEAIGSILDAIRLITVNLGPGQQPSPEQNRQLLDIYLQLEQYLTTKEPLRTFTPEGLRRRLAEPLRNQLKGVANKPHA